MQKPFRFSATILLTLILCNTFALGQKAKGPKLLSPDAIDIAQLLPDPPSPDSPETHAELKTVLAVQGARTPADIEQAKADVDLDVFSFATILGPQFDAEHCPRTAALFKMVEADAKFFARQGKEHWNRRRPPFVDPQIKPCVPLEDEGSYPSSHGTRGMLYAELLAELMPSSRATLLEQGRQFGWARVIGGVHYPSDIEAGRVLGHALAVKLLADPHFTAKLSSLEQEIAAATAADHSTTQPVANRPG